MLVLISVQACASATDQSQTVPVTEDIGGQWSGISVASCIPFQTPSGRCNAQQKVTFSFVKNRIRLVGLLLVRVREHGLPQWQ